MLELEICPLDDDIFIELLDFTELLDSSELLEFIELLEISLDEETFSLLLNFTSSLDDETFTELLEFSTSLGIKLDDEISSLEEETTAFTQEPLTQT